MAVMSYFISLCQKQHIFSVGRVSAVLNLLEYSLLVKLAVFNKDDDSILLAAMLVSISLQTLKKLL
ncbi:hypothetical protein GCM10027286_04600 [Virgibacillus ainsalahensis]